ncbi:MAG: hypothetical protein A2W25_12210 [candidate division Zixibacteria bacterium RBG_16_53_22]|nr:MAG: hypothetical protein A2W25_12210 [candidate division Zixibacteria bacterium RBG_16_53_22]
MEEVVCTLREFKEATEKAQVVFRHLVNVFFMLDNPARARLKADNMWDQIMEDAALIDDRLDEWADAAKE